MDRGDGPLRLDLYTLLMKLRHGGMLVSGTQCTREEVAFARVEFRLFIDKDGHGYVYRPPVCPQGGS